VRKIFLGLRYGFVIACLCFLVSCTRLPDISSTTTRYQQQSWQQRRLALSEVTHWHIDGAFSVRQPQQSTIAAYQWQQQETQYRIHIYSSLDLYGINIVGRPGAVTLWRAQNQPLTANSPEALMQQTLGWRLPISNLYYWLRGLPAPGHYQARFDRYGHLVQLQQQGWQINYANYQSVGTLDLPQSLSLSHGDLAVKIIIKHWASTSI
jgi:outer membrane lipoprotein LolB